MSHTHSNDTFSFSFFDSELFADFPVSSQTTLLSDSLFLICSDCENIFVSFLFGRLRLQMQSICVSSASITPNSIAINVTWSGIMILIQFLITATTLPYHLYPPSFGDYAMLMLCKMEFKN